MPPAPEDSQRQRMLKQLRDFRRKGETVFSEGEESRELYILLSGRIEIRKGESVIAVVQDRDTYFGEMSTLLGTPRTATCVAVEDCEMIRVPEDRVVDFFNHSPSLALKLSRILAQRLQEMNIRHQKVLRRLGGATSEDLDIFDSLVRTDGHKRMMAAYRQETGESFPLPDINAFINVPLGEMNRIIRDYEQAGLVRIDDGTLHFVEAPAEGLRRLIDIFGHSAVES